MSIDTVRRAGRLLAILAVVLSGGTAVSLADGVIRDGVGARPSGRGATNVAFTDNGQILLDNPAAMARISGTQLDEVGADILFTDLRYQDAQNGYTEAVDNPFPAGQIALIRRDADRGIAYGLGMFAPAGFSSEYTLNGPAALPGPRHYKSIGALARILPGAAVQVTDRLSVGGTLGVAVSHLELEGPYFLQSPGPLQGTPTILDLQGTGAALAWSVGMQFALSDATTLGVTYQNQTKFDLDGSTRVEVPGLGRTRFDSELNVKWPRSLTTGVRHELCGCRTIGLDLVWFDWSSAFDATILRLRDPVSPVYQAVVGNLYKDRFPLDWRDSLSVRFGMEQDLREGQSVRVGYVYHRNPIPDRTLTTFIQATLEHAFTVGYGWKMDGYDVDVAYQFSFSPDRHVGSSALAGGDFSNSQVGTQVHWLFLSLRRSG